MHSFRPHAWMPAILLAVLTGINAQAAESPGSALTNLTVGEWADSRRLEFSGLNTFSARQVRSGLLSDLPFLLASHPQAPRADYLPTLERRVIEGYLSDGFPNVRVAVFLDTTNRRVRVAVTEGPRYLAGDIHITGATTISHSNLIRRLAEKWIPTGLPEEAQQGDAITYINSAGEEVRAKNPLWERNKPARFDTAVLEFVTERMTNALAEAGCFFPRVKPRVVIRAGTNLADLHIDIEEGQSARLGRVDVLGLKRNTSDAVLQWLNLAPGQALTNDLIGRLERQLWQSARFRTYHLVPTPVPGRPELADLELSLEELPAAPLLGQEFSREEQVMLKFRDWLLNATASGDDLVLTSHDFGGYEVVLSARGAVAVLRQDNEDCYAAMIGPGRTALLSLHRQRQWDHRSMENHISLALSLLPKLRDAEGDGYFTLGLSAGFTLRGGLQATPLQLQLALAPVAFVHMAHPTNQTVRFVDNTLVVSGEGLSFKLDAATGRLVEAVGEGMRLRVERGAFDRRWQELAARSDTMADRGTNRPFNSWVGLLTAELFHVGMKLMSTNASDTAVTSQRALATSTMEKLLTAALASLDPFITANFVATNQFSIPNPPSGVGDSARLTGLARMAAFIFEYADQLFPARSWPWTLARESVFTLGGLGRHTDAELKSMYASTENGPLAFLTTAALLQQIGSPSTPAFAARGLERLTPEYFLKDVQLVLDPETQLGRMFHDAARTLRDLPAEELAALTVVLPKTQGAFLRLTVNALKAAPDQPIATTLTPLLEEFWKSDLRKRVESALRTLAGDAAATSQRNQHYEEGIKAQRQKRYAEAARLFRKSADLGQPQAQYVLAQYLDQGHGLPRDEAAATRWYHVAASNGVVEAQTLLGSRYSLALDGPGDLLEAYYWYSLAAKQGDRAAEAFRASVRRKLNPAQLEEAERRLAAPRPAKSAKSAEN